MLFNFMVLAGQPALTFYCLLHEVVLRDNNYVTRSATLADMQF